MLHSFCWWKTIKAESPPYSVYDTNRKFGHYRYIYTPKKSSRLPRKRKITSDDNDCENDNTGTIEINDDVQMEVADNDNNGDLDQVCGAFVNLRIPLAE